MTNLLRFDDLQAILHQHTAHVPDHRKPSPNTRYTMQDAALGAFGMFFTQAPSCLAYQRRLQHTTGHNNAQTLFGVEKIPCDNQIRTLLDPIAPSHVDPVFVEVFERLAQRHLFDSFRVLGDRAKPGVQTRALCPVASSAWLARAGRPDGRSMALQHSDKLATGPTPAMRPL